MTQLKKMAIKLEQEQVYEPVDTLFIVRKRGSLLYRCFGYGELCERFIKGEPLTDYPPYMDRKQKVMPEVEKDEKIEFLTPEKDLFNFGRGSGRTLAEIQKESLDNLPVKIIPGEVNVEKPGPSKTRKIPTLHERSTIGRGRGRGGTRGKGRGRGRKRKRESSSDSNDDEDRIRIEESSSDEDETRLSPLLPLESTLMRENPGPSNMSKPGPSNMSKPGPSNERKERLKKLYERSTTGRGKGRGKGRAKGRGRGMKRKRESSSDSSDSGEEIRPLDKNPRKKLFRKDIIEDSNDEKETDMTGLSPFLPLDSSLMNEASILIEELSFNFEKDQEDNEEIVEEKMEEENQSREEKSEQDLSGKEKEKQSGKEKLEENQSGKGNEEQSVEEKLEEHESGEEKEELSGEEKEELSGEEKEELSGEEKEELSGEEKLEEKQKSKKKNRFSVGEHVKVTFGKEDFPAIVTDLDDSGVWGQFFRRKGASGWALDDIKYFIIQKDILKSLTPPDLVPLGGSRFSYKFEDF